MIKKDILELKRRFKKDQCTFTKLCGCYVNGEKQILLNFRETFLNLPEEEFFKYLEISKKVLSGTIGNNLLELNFPLNENFSNEKQRFLLRLRDSKLKDDNILETFYQSIIDSYDIAGNFLILVFHDAYDVMVKTSDNIKLDESEEVYEYIMCAICPVTLSNPGLSYFDEEQKIKPRIRDWIVGVPIHGFTYPAFIERSTDVNSIMYYTKNAKDPHPELMEEALGCTSKQTATIQKETFQTIIENSVGMDEKESEAVFTQIQETLNSMVEEYNEMYDDTDCEPITLTKDSMQNLLKESGVPDEVTTMIEASFDECFGDDLPLAESLIDSKLLKANEHKKKEIELTKQVEALETKLDEVTRTAEAVEDASTDDTNDAADKATEDVVEDVVDDAVEDVTEDVSEDSIDDAALATANYDVVLHVKPSKISEIKTEMINGQRCIVVPINDDELATINGQRNLI